MGPGRWRGGLPGAYGFSPGDLDLLINSSDTIDWGAYNPAQLYTRDLVGTGSPTTSSGRKEDELTYYGDNAGGLCVTVFKDSGIEQRCISAPFTSQGQHPGQHSVARPARTLPFGGG